MDFKKNDTIELDLGSEKIRIIQKIGEGGQGAVYKVDLNGKEYALKWYFKPPEKKFYKNLKRNIEKGSPDKTFLWPLFLTKKDRSGCFGYVMELRPPEYKEFSQYLLAKVQFNNIEAMLNAAINICVGFRTLHSKGFSYQDVNDGNFFINPMNGDVLICDNDNVAPFGTNTGIVGKCRYMAPEVVNGKKKPDSQSDRFSLSVILFLLIFGNHPLEGRNITSFPCMTEKHEKELYGNKAVFIYDPTDDSNRPVQGIHRNVINKWKLYPPYVRDFFIKAFSKETLLNSDKRIVEKEWIEKLFQRLYHELFKCYCGEYQFFDIGADSYKCTACKKEYNKPPLLRIKDKTMVLVKDKIVYKYLTESIIDNGILSETAGIVIESSKHPGVFGLKNLTNNTWMLTLKDGTQRTIAPDKPAPLLIGNKINFGNGISGEII